MTLEDLMPVLERIQGATFASMDTRTLVGLTGGRKNPMKDRVWKVSKNHRVMVFTNKNSNAYQNMVNRRLEKEGKSVDFIVAERKWGTRLPNLPIVEHKGKYYLEVIFLHSGTVEYYLDNEPIETDAIEGFKITPKDSGRQGLEPEHAVIIRTFALESITELRIMKEIL